MDPHDGQLSYDVVSEYLRYDGTNVIRHIDQIAAKGFKLEERVSNSYYEIVVDLCLEPFFLQIRHTHGTRKVIEEELCAREKELFVSYEELNI
jgi:hypothetical protein